MKLPGLLTIRRKQRVSQVIVEADLTALETTVDAIDAVPALVFAVEQGGGQAIFCDFGVALTANPTTLVVGAWTGTVATNGGAPAALTVTGVVCSTRRVTIGVSGTPFEPDIQSVQSITLTYDAGTGNLLDAAGRAINSFSVDAVVPRQDNPNAEFLLMAEQGSAPSTPDSGYGAIYVGTDQDLHFVDDVGNDTGVLALPTGILVAIAGILAGTVPFDPGALFTEQGADPATPAAGNWMAFFKAGGLYVIDDAGAVTGPFATLADTLDEFADPVASVNFNDQQAVSFRLENRTSDPGSPTGGQIWLRTDL